MKDDEALNICLLLRAKPAALLHHSSHMCKAVSLTFKILCVTKPQALQELVG